VDGLAHLGVGTFTVINTGADKTGLDHGYLTWYHSLPFDFGNKGSPKYPLDLSPGGFRSDGHGVCVNDTKLL
jgi:hypothetical protein